MSVDPALAAAAVAAASSNNKLRMLQKQKKQQQRPQYVAAAAPATAAAASAPVIGQKRPRSEPSPPVAKPTAAAAAIAAQTEAHTKRSQKKQKVAAAAASAPARAAQSKATATAAPAGSGVRQLSVLQQKMAAKLAGARFRWLNEKLYTCTGSEAWEYFQAHPEEFDEYHRGFGVQVLDWPSNPLDGCIAFLKQRSPALIAGDFGCGEARLAASVPNQVHSFDLVAVNERVTACNISAVPLQDGALDVAIFCLSLMGVDFLAFIREAHRTLKQGSVHIRTWMERIGHRSDMLTHECLCLYTARVFCFSSCCCCLCVFQRHASDQRGAQSLRGGWSGRVRACGVRGGLHAAPQGQQLQHHVRHDGIREERRSSGREARSNSRD